MSSTCRRTILRPGPRPADPERHPRDPGAADGVRTASAQGEATAKIEVTLMEPQADGTWSALAKPLRKLGRARRWSSRDDLSATMSWPRGRPAPALQPLGRDFDAALNAAGAMPLPPYIAGKRAPDARDREDYQTDLGQTRGRRRRPHRLAAFRRGAGRGADRAGIDFTFVTLHVGAGTFLPVTVDDVTTHKMHAEWGEVTRESGRRRDQRDPRRRRADHPRGHHRAAPDRDGGAAQGGTMRPLRAIPISSSTRATRSGR
jgi:S-adenosylmethionine:tRNA ribosyltransferase-isomerase